MSKMNVKHRVKHLRILGRNDTDDEVLPVFPQKSLNFEIYGLLFLWEIVFGVISGNYLYLALRNCKNDCKMLKITLVQIFVH